MILRILSVHFKKFLLLSFRITTETTKAFADLSQNIILVGAQLCSDIATAKGFLFVCLFVSFFALNGSKWDTGTELEISLCKNEQI